MAASSPPRFRLNLSEGIIVRFRIFRANLGEVDEVDVMLVTSEGWKKSEESRDRSWSARDLGILTLAVRFAAA